MIHWEKLWTRSFHPVFPPVDQTLTFMTSTWGSFSCFRITSVVTTTTTTITTPAAAAVCVLYLPLICDPRSKYGLQRPRLHHNRNCSFVCSRCTKIHEITRFVFYVSPVHATGTAGTVGEVFLSLLSPTRAVTQTSNPPIISLTFDPTPDHEPQHWFIQ